MEITKSIFREYDIRGEYPNQINEEVVRKIGNAIAGKCINLNIKEICVGRDGRNSGKSLLEAMIGGLSQSGIEVINIDLATSPLLYYAAKKNKYKSGIMITGSHNPKNHNGIKLVINDKPVSGNEILDLLNKDQKFSESVGSIKSLNVKDSYIEEVSQSLKINKKLKIVIDCGNGAAGFIAPDLYKNLGCEVIELYSEVDGNFPNHHPDPTIPANLTDLITTVKAEQADIGLALDGDADRLGIVTNEGEIIWPDRQLMLYAADCLQRNPGEQILFDVKCTNRLPQYIAQHGGQPIMGKTGHSLMKAKMKELNVPMAGEMSGHIFFNDEWYGFDDGLYVAARLLRILAAQSLPASALFATLPNSINTPELKLPMADVDKPEFMQRLSVESNFNEQERITIDGLRLEFEHGWGLIRPSNTSPYLIIRFEADNADYLEEIKALFRRELLALDAQLQLPF